MAFCGQLDEYIPLPGEDIKEQPGSAAWPRQVRGAKVWAPGTRHSPPIEWIIDGWIAHRKVTVIAAEPGVGKSVATFAALLSPFIGCPWLGHDVKGGATVWLAYEDADSRDRHQLALDPDLSAPMFLVEDAPQLADDRAFDDICTIVDDVGEVLRKPVKIVVVDTLGAATVGCEEKGGRDSGIFMHVLRRLADERGLAVIVLTHTAKGDDGGHARGNLSIIARSDTELAIGTNKDGTRYLRQHKQRIAPKLPDVIKFRIVERNGVPDVELVERGGAAELRADRLAPDAAAVLAVIENAGAVPWETLRAEFTDALQSVKQRSAGAIRKSLSTCKTKLTDSDFIRFDDGIVTVTDRYLSVAGNDAASAKSVTAMRYRSPPFRGDGNVGSAPTRRTANGVARWP